MKTCIDSQNGIRTFKEEKGVVIEGKQYYEAPFENRWDDLRAVINEGTGGSALTYEQYRNTGFFMRFFRHNQPDKIFMTYQMPHGWDTSSSVKPHMHLIPMASGSGEIHFDYAYTWANVNETFNGAIGWVSGSASVEVTPEDQYKHLKLGFVTVPAPETAKASSILIFKVERNQASDTYESTKDHGTSTANVAILEFDLHYQKICAGTVGET